MTGKGTIVGGFKHKFLVAGSPLLPDDIVVEKFLKQAGPVDAHKLKLGCLAF